MEYYEIPGISADQLSILKKVRREIENETTGQRQWVTNRVLVELARRAVQDGIAEPDAFEGRLNDGIHEIEEIRSGLIGNLRHVSLTGKACDVPELKRLVDYFSKGIDDAADYNEREETIKTRIDKESFFYDFEPSRFRADEYHHTPVSFSLLTDATKRYFERPWVQSQVLDWYLINGFLRFYLDEYLENLYTGELFGRTSWRRIFCRGKRWAYFGATALYWLASLIVDWLLLPVLAAVAIYFNYNYVAAGLLGVFGILLILRILYIPRFVRQARTKRRLINGVQELFNIKVYASNKIWSPSTLMDRIEAFERNYPELPIPPLRSLLALAVKRGPEIAI